MISDAHILITGGAGFIGTALSKRLVDRNRIRILDNLSRDGLGGTELSEHPNLELQVGDIRDRAAVDRACEGVDYIVHMASIAGVDTVLNNPVLTMEVSIEGTSNVLKAAKAQGGVKRIIDFSTSEVFGSHAFRVRETDVTSLGAVGEARWTYAVSKLATEHLTHNYWKEFGLPTCSIRPFNIYGPGQIGQGAVHAFVVKALANDPITIHNNGDQIRAWCYIDDIIEGVLKCMALPDAIGHAFNIGNPRSTLTIYQLALLVRRLAKSSSEINFVDWDFPDVELRIPNVKKADEILDFRAMIDLEDGLGRTIEWYRQKAAGAK